MNMLVWLIAILGAAAAWILAPLLLSPLSSSGEVGDASDSLLAKVGRLVFGGLNRRPAMQTSLDNLDARLRLAGRRGIPSETVLAQAQGAGILATLTLCIVLSVVSGGFGLGTLVMSIIMGAATTWLVLTRVENWISDRRRQLNRQFPYFLDLAVMTMDSGTGMLEVVDAYTKSAPGTALAQELTALNTDIRMGTTVDAALIALESRIPSDDVIAVTRSIRQGLRMGTPMSQVFREQAETMRFRRSQTAERSAEELKVKLQGPAMMLVVAVLILVLGPAFVGMTQGGM